MTTSDDPLVTAVGQVLEPLAHAVEHADELRHLLASLGIDAEIDGAAREEILSVFAAGPALSDLLDALDPFDPLVVLSAAASVWGAIDDLRNISTGSIATLPAPLDELETWQRLADALPAQLVATWLSDQAPAVQALLEVTGVITRSEPVVSTPLPAFTADWSALGAAIADPAGRMTDRLRWGDEIEARPLQQTLAMLAESVGRVRWVPVPLPVVDAHYDGVPPLAAEAESLLITIGPLSAIDRSTRGELALTLSPIGDGSITMPTGFQLSLGGWGTIGTAELGPGWLFETRGLAGPADLEVVVRPNGVVIEGPFDDEAIGVTVTRTPEQPWRLFGTENSNRIEVDSASFSVDVLAGSSGTGADLVAAIEVHGLRFVAGDGALGRLITSLAGGEVGPSADVTLAFSTSSGVRLNGSAALAVQVGNDIPIGLVTIRALEIRLVASPAGGITVESTANLLFDLGPFAAAVNGIGLSVDMDPATAGNLGPLNARLGVTTPTGIALQIGTDLVGGSGVLVFDADEDSYAGAVTMGAAGVGLSATTVITGGDQWTLFASLQLTLPGIPLGFGFVLTGAGGIVAVGRTVDVEALATGLLSGSVNGLMFPTGDPIEQALDLIDQLDAWFPKRAGTTVIGPIVQISWGVSTVVTGELGILLSLPDTTIVVLGSIEIALPSPEVGLLELHMDAVGAFDPLDGTVTLVASLYDSHLLHTISLSGDMAFYATFGASPAFLLSVGGYHPGFQPPAIVPSSILDLRRMQAHIPLGIGLSATFKSYLAVTSNTVQFGASLEVVAEAKILFTVYTARGWFDLDVLLVLVPFSITADIAAGVTVSAGDKELFGVAMGVHIEGPEPWYALARAEFRFFGIDVSFEVEVGREIGSATREIVDVLSQVIGAFELEGSWSEVPPPGSAASVVTVEAPADGTLWVRPDHRLRASQSIAPLVRELSAFGAHTPSPTFLAITGAGLSGTAVTGWDTVEDWFAPAQFDRLPMGDRLTLPSYEQMVSGVTFGDESIAISDRNEQIATAPEGYEEVRWSPVGTPNATLTPGPLAQLGRILAPATRAVEGTAYTLAAVTYDIVDVVDGMLADDGAAGIGLGYAAALRTLDAEVVAGASLGDRRVTPSRPAEALAR